MTVLFSATQTKNVEDLARISLKKAPLYVGVDDHKETATVEGLEQVGSSVRVRTRVQKVKPKMAEIEERATCIRRQS